MPRFDWEPRDAYKAIYGLPLTFNPYDQTYLIGGRGGKRITAETWQELQKMANRPYKDLKPGDLTKLLTEQLEASFPPPQRIDATVFGDANKTYLAGGTTASPYFEMNRKLWAEPIFDSKTNVETVFRVGADGHPEAVTRLVNHPKPDSVRNAGETDLAWLRRRVSEICWSPT